MGPNPDLGPNQDAKKINSTIFGVLAKSKKFEFTTLSIIVLNALFIGYLYARLRPDCQSTRKMNYIGSFLNEGNGTG